MPQSFIDDGYAPGSASAAAEYGAHFRSDIEGFLALELIEAAVDRGVVVRPPRPGVSYVGFVDAASGISKDSFAVAVAHMEGNEAVLDLAP